MISERFNTKFRLFSGSSGSGSSTGPSGTTTTPSTETTSGNTSNKSSRYKVNPDGTISNPSIVSEKVNPYYEQPKQTKTPETSSGNTSSSPKTVSSSSNNHANKDTIVSNDRSNYNPTPTTTTAPEQNSNQAYVDSGNNGGSNQKSIGDYTDEELEQAIKALEKGSNTQFGNVFKKLYESAIEKYKAELAKRHPTPTQTPETAPVVETVAQTQPVIAQTQPIQTTQQTIPAPNPTPTQTTETVPSPANTQVENEQPEQEERKPYVPHEVAYTAEGEKGNRFNRQAVADDLNKAFNNLYLIGSGNYYNQDGSANQNLYGMNNA